MNWKQEPYKSAMAFTGGDKKLALEVIELAEWVNEIGLTEYPNTQLIESGRYEW